MHSLFPSRSVALALALLAVVATQPAAAQDAGEARLKDLIRLEGALPLQLTGYGLVIGLDRTGDRARGLRGSPYTVQSIANMLREFGVDVPAEALSSRNVAAVMVTATLEPFLGVGASTDVTISSIGDAKSLSGGVLLQTPLLNPLDQQVYALAQGPVSTGAVLASSLGSSVKVNYTNTGRIPNGGLVVQSLTPQLNVTDAVALLLRRPDFKNASRIAEVINETYPDVATVTHAGRVEVAVPDAVDSASELLAALEDLSVEIDVPARVVVNERTGTIVAGGDVRINEVMVTYGSLVISTQETPFVSQPEPFSETGETVAGAAGAATVTEEGTRSLVLPPNTDVNELAAALNELGLTARDVIAIFQAIDRAAALQGELIIQ